jgi:hypothetical protein
MYGSNSRLWNERLGFDSLDSVIVVILKILIWGEKKRGYICVMTSLVMVPIGLTARSRQRGRQKYQGHVSKDTV